MQSKYIPCINSLIKTRLALKTSAEKHSRHGVVIILLLKKSNKEQLILKDIELLQTLRYNTLIQCTWFHEKTPFLFTLYCFLNAF